MHVGVWSKYFIKIPFKRNISWFQNNKETKKRHVLLKDEMWSQNKMQMAKFHNNMIANSSPFLDQLFWQYLCFTKHFRSLVILKIFGGWYGQWLIFQKFNLPLVHYPLNSILEILATVQLNGLKFSYDIQISCLDYTT